MSAWRNWHRLNAGLDSDQEIENRVFIFVKIVCVWCSRSTRHCSRSYLSIFVKIDGRAKCISIYRCTRYNLISIASDTECIDTDQKLMDLKSFDHNKIILNAHGIRSLLATQSSRMHVCVQSKGVWQTKIHSIHRKRIYSCSASCNYCRSCFCCSHFRCRINNQSLNLCGTVEPSRSLACSIDGSHSSVRCTMLLCCSLDDVRMFTWHPHWRRAYTHTNSANVCSPSPSLAHSCSFAPYLSPAILMQSNHIFTEIVANYLLLRFCLPLNYVIIIFGISFFHCVCTGTGGHSVRTLHSYL